MTNKTTSAIDLLAQLRSDCRFLLSCIDMCNEAGSPPSEMDPDDVALVEQIRASLENGQ